jgi:hypothetical protein
VLRLLEIDTVDDLRQLETDLVSFFTSKWFRLLERPKDEVKSRENRVAVHPLWERVQSTFVRFFPGEGKPIESVSFKRDKPITCEPNALLKQAKGCLKTAMALMFGAQSTVNNVYDTLFAWVDGMKHEVFVGLNERAHKLQVVTGVAVHRDENVLAAKRRAEDWITRLKYERGRCFG